jgi:hypothetical protein
MRPRREARRWDPEGKRPWVMLVDGHEGQIEDIHAALERHGVEVTLILDFIHDHSSGDTEPYWAFHKAEE